jgi:hypothetical protein
MADYFPLLADLIADNFQIGLTNVGFVSSTPRYRMNSSTVNTKA